MKKFLIGNKIGMTELILENGDVVPATVIKSYKNQVIRVKTPDSDGYSAVVIGYDVVSSETLSKPKKGQFSTSDAYKRICEFRISENNTHVAGDSFDVSQFNESDKVNVRGKSKGRGFSGTIRRWNFNRGPMSHGSKSHRIPGSIGGGTTPGRVVKGKKMAGRHGAVLRTISNLLVVKIDTEKSLLFVKGAIPGANGSEVLVSVGQK